MLSSETDLQTGSSASTAAGQRQQPQGAQSPRQVCAAPHFTQPCQAEQLGPGSEHLIEASPGPAQRSSSNSGGNYSKRFPNSSQSRRRISPPPLQHYSSALLDTQGDPFEEDEDLQQAEEQSGAPQAFASASSDMASTGDDTPRAAAAEAAPTASVTSSSQQVSSAGQKPSAALESGTPAGGAVSESSKPALTKRGSGKKGIVSPKPTPKPASPSTPQPATPLEGIAGSPSDSAAGKAAAGSTGTASSSAASQAAVSAKLAQDTIEPGAGELAAVQAAQASGSPIPAGSRLHGDGRPVEGSPAAEARAAGGKAASATSTKQEPDATTEQEDSKVPALGTEAASPNSGSMGVTGAASAESSPVKDTEQGLQAGKVNKPPAGAIATPIRQGSAHVQQKLQEMQNGQRLRANGVQAAGTPVSNGVGPGGGADADGVRDASPQGSATKQGLQDGPAATEGGLEGTAPADEPPARPATARGGRGRGRRIAPPAVKPVAPVAAAAQPVEPSEGPQAAAGSSAAESSTEAAAALQPKLASAGTDTVASSPQSAASAQPAPRGKEVDRAAPVADVEQPGGAVAAARTAAPEAEPQANFTGGQQSPVATASTSGQLSTPTSQRKGLDCPAELAGAAQAAPAASKPALADAAAGGTTGKPQQRPDAAAPQPAAVPQQQAGAGQPQPERSGSMIKRLISQHSLKVVQGVKSLSPMNMQACSASEGTPPARRPSEDGPGKPKSDAEMPEAIKVLRKRFSGSFVDPMHKTPSEGPAKVPQPRAESAVPPRAFEVKHAVGSKTLPYEELKGLTPEHNAGIDFTCKESYLDDDEFAKVFQKWNLDKSKFQAQPKWRQIMQKKEVGLW